MRISFYLATALFASMANAVWVEQTVPIEKVSTANPNVPANPLTKGIEAPFTVTTDGSFSKFSITGGEPKALQSFIGNMQK